ncbi:MAG: NAD(P)/FAD-dependent oxidoreductase [Bacteroidales bacterium]|nr:NAD(P)/FAD-dependent oxidoreductase [Bacteroidales bacterium]
MAKPYDFVIIGAGISGLSLASILSKEGFRVALVEKNRFLGGNLSSFKKEGVIFDTGIHYTGGFDDGRILDIFFKYLGIRSKIQLKRQDLHCFDEVQINEDKFEFAQGYDLHIDKMCNYFPQYCKQIKDYYNEIVKYGSLTDIDSIFSKVINFESLSIGVYKKVFQTIGNERITNILTATNALYAGKKGITPFVIHAHVLDAYINDSWKFVGGGQHLADAMAELIEANGGKIFKGSAATTFNFDDRNIKSVSLSDGECVEGRRFISTLHPQVTLKMLPEQQWRKSTVDRIQSIPNTMGMFSLYLVMKPKSFQYINHNIYHFEHYDTWMAERYDPNKWPESFLIYSQVNDPNQEYADGIVVMTYMDYSEVTQWSGLRINNRGEAYQAFKNEKTELLLKKVERSYPGIRAKIQTVYSSTPVTYESYYNMPEGASYGIQRNCNDPIINTLMSVTKTPNLFLAGQSVSIHGLFGVIVGSVILASYFIGKEHLINKLNQTT